MYYRLVSVDQSEYPLYYQDGEVVRSIDAVTIWRCEYCYCPHEAEVIIALPICGSTTVCAEHAATVYGLANQPRTEPMADPMDAMNPYHDAPSHKLIEAATHAHREIDSYARTYGREHEATQQEIRLAEPIFAELRARGYAGR